MPLCKYKLMENNDKNKPNILYVDDIDTNLILFETAFKNDFTVFTAGSAEKALELLEKEKFTIIVSDQRMPGMSGTELLENVRQKYPRIMRFMLTAYSDYQTVVDSINKGQIYGFFNKPFDFKDMLISLNKAVEVYNLRECNLKMTEEIEKTNLELRNIDKSKTAFLNTITSELRSPIHKIMSAVHMLKDTVVSSDLAELVNYLDTSVSRLEQFSSVTKQLSKLTEGKEALNLTDVSLREVVEVCILEKKDIFQSAGMSIQIAENSETLIIKGDYELILSCLTTLLDILFGLSEKDGIIRLLYGKDDSSWFIEINFKGDNSKKMTDKLSKQFSKNENPYDFTPGIEAMLAKQVMAAHNGKIELILNEDKSISFRMVFSTDSITSV